VDAGAIVEALDPSQDGAARLGQVGEAAVMDEFVLEAAEEAFGHGVVPGVAFSAHAGERSLPLLNIALDRARIDRPLIRVVDQAWPRLSSFDRHARRGDTQVQGLALSHRPSHDLAREEIDQRGEKQPA
jgi:hypothetical protein